MVLSGVLIVVCLWGYRDNLLLVGFFVFWLSLQLKIRSGYMFPWYNLRIPLHYLLWSIIAVVGGYKWLCAIIYFSWTFNDLLLFGNVPFLVCFLIGGIEMCGINMIGLWWTSILTTCAYLTYTFPIHLWLPLGSGIPWLWSVFGHSNKFYLHFIHID